MDKPRYTVEIVIAAPGTPLVDERGVQKVVDGVPQTSGPGHMFYVLHGPDKTTRSFGFAPSEHGSMNGPGEVMRTDAAEYRNPHYSRTLEISEQQYKKLEAFGAHPDIRLRSAIQGRAPQLRGLHLGSAEPRRHRAEEKYRRERAGRSCRAASSGCAHSPGHEGRRQGRLSSAAQHPRRRQHRSTVPRQRAQSYENQPDARSHVEAAPAERDRRHG